MNKMGAIAMAGFVMMGAACYSTNEAEEAQREATQRMQAEAQAQVGMPDIVNWTERRQMKDILELRDQPNLATFTYIVNWQGQLLPLCRSLGYGLPYSVQYTNPESVQATSLKGGMGDRVVDVLPQPDPNGLYMPDGLNATWVLCVDPDTGEPDPVYVEPEIIVSRFELDLADWGNPGRAR